jgi:hypothetical protein
LAKLFVICQSCDCHVRIAERKCPHCGADVAACGGVRAPRRRSVEVRRVFLATALAGMGAASCGGREIGAGSNLPAEATEADIQGGCFVDGSYLFGACGSATGSCACGAAGFCAMGQCQQKSCTATEYVDSAGNCVALPSCPADQTLDGNTCVPSTHTCYGAPPLIG